MKIRRFESRALSLCLIVAIIATYSMVALAGEKRLAGEILVSGSNIDGNAPAVLVNGEEIKSGRTIFSSSSISTSANSSAVVSMGKIGSLRIAPNSSLILTFSEKGINCELLTGQFTVLNAADKVNVSLPGGKTAELSAGNTASTAVQDDDDDDKVGGGAWFLWAVVVGGAAATFVWFATKGNNRVDVGGGTTIVSPNL